MSGFAVFMTCSGLVQDAAVVALSQSDLHVQARALCTATERNSAWVGRARDKVDFAPKDAQQVASFLAVERDMHQVICHLLAHPELSLLHLGCHWAVERH